MRQLWDCTLMELELYYFGTVLFLIIAVIFTAYSITNPEFKNYSLTLIFLLFVFMAMLFAPAQLIWFEVLAFLILFFNLMMGTLFDKFFLIEEDQILIDKVPQVWEQFEQPPELKEVSA